MSEQSSSLSSGSSISYSSAEVDSCVAKSCTQYGSTPRLSAGSTTFSKHCRRGVVLLVAARPLPAARLRLLEHSVSSAGLTKSGALPNHPATRLSYLGCQQPSGESFAVAANLLFVRRIYCPTC